MGVDNISLMVLARVNSVSLVRLEYDNTKLKIERADAVGRMMRWDGKWNSRDAGRLAMLTASWILESGNDGGNNGNGNRVCCQQHPAVTKHRMKKE